MSSTEISRHQKTEISMEMWHGFNNGPRGNYRNVETEQVNKSRTSRNATAL